MINSKSPLAAKSSKQDPASKASGEINFNNSIGHLPSLHTDKETEAVSQYWPGRCVNLGV